jgi:hypothetical protein
MDITVEHVVKILKDKPTELLATCEYIRLQHPDMQQQLKAISIIILFFSLVYENQPVEDSLVSYLLRLLEHLQKLPESFDKEAVLILIKVILDKDK